jgi:hypothetical protein
MFSRTSPNVIDSDEGFSVELLGRTGLVYWEGKRSMRIVSEVLSASLMVAAPTIRAWNPPYEKEPIDDERRKQILDNIIRAFREAYGLPVEVMW